MPITAHWFLPTSGDSKTLLGSGRVLARSDRRIDDTPGDRPASVKYLGQVARAAEELGFTAALTPTGTWCEDAWLITAALTQVTERLKFLVALRPGVQSPTLAAQAAATYQRLSGGRLLLNTVIGGDDTEQRRYGDYLDKDARYARADEWLQVVRGVWSGEPFSLEGEHVKVTDALLLNPPQWPEVYLGGASAAALRTAARQADVYLTWGEPPAQVAEQLARVRAEEARLRELETPLRFGIRLHVVARANADDAWAAAEALIADADQATIDAAQGVLSGAVSEGQQRQIALHKGNRDNLEVSPNLWAGLGLLRPGAGTALVGSYDEVADRIAEYHELGIDEFIFSGYPHLEEAYETGEGLLPVLRRRGLLVDHLTPAAEPAAAAA
jgi:alkanesulfonate monooxygenase